MLYRFFKIQAKGKSLASYDFTAKTFVEPDGVAQSLNISSKPN